MFENSDVTILGVAVGKISEIEPVGDRVRVLMTIDADYKIPADTHAEIVPISVISDRYVEFDVYQGGPVLQDGATLQVADTEIPAELDDVFLQLKKLLDALKPDGEGNLGSLGELIVALDEALEGREQDLKGTLVNGAKLTQTLARARGDISGLLVNLDELFKKLAPRAGSIATLNKNFATVMRFLVESRTDIEGTLEGLGNITLELGDLVKDDGAKLASLLQRAAKITPIVLKNQKSVEQSLDWLSVVAEGLGNAYHGGEFKSTDVRSARTTAGICEDLDDLPIDPDDFPPPLDDIIRDILNQLEAELCPNPSSASQPQAGPSVPPETVTPPTPPDVIPDLKIDCDKGVRRVKRQIKRIENIGIPSDVKEGVLGPLEDNLKELAKKCRELGDALEDPDALDKLLEDLPPDLQDLLQPPPGGTNPDEPVDDLSGSASGAAPAAPSTEADDSEGDSWVDGLMSFLGVS
ncbi:MAG TPA: MCE family protein [Actinomycetota bacterium]|nr:MCE family protein [Actinomycetota bacterium]